MTDELTKIFFDTFWIEPKKQCYYWDCPYSTGNIVNDTPMDERDCNSCKNPNKEIYPEITDRILLELIVINMHNEDLFGYPTNIQELKDNTLKQLIETYNKFSTCVTCDGDYQQTAREIKHQVHRLFEER